MDGAEKNGPGFVMETDYYTGGGQRTLIVLVFAPEIIELFDQLLCANINF